jgi:hypothetical protein
MYCYKLWNNKSMKHQLSEFIYLYFHLYSCYIKIYIYIFFFLVKFHTFGFILKKCATVATDMHFSSQYVIRKVCLTHAHSVYGILTGIWYLEMKHDHRSWQNHLQSKHTHVWLLQHFTMTLYSSDCLTDNRRFFLPCGLNLYFLISRATPYM